MEKILNRSDPEEDEEDSLELIDFRKVDKFELVDLLMSGGKDSA